MSFRIIRDDITRVRADAIVNTANPEPVYRNGTDRAVYEAAGAEQLLAARKKIGRMEAGEAAVTDAFALPARWIIHTVGPTWQDGSHGEYEALASCYRQSLRLAAGLGCRSVAFPLISTGVCGFPRAAALQTALAEIDGFLKQADQELEVILVVFNREAFEISASLHYEIDQFIDERYAQAKHRQEHPDSFYSENRRPGRETANAFYGESRRREREAPDAPFRKNRWSWQHMDGGMVDAFDESLSANDVLDLPEREEEDAVLQEPMYLEDASGPPELSEQVDDRLSSRKSKTSNVLLNTLSFLREALPFAKPSEKDLEEALNHPGENFQQMLLRLIDERQLTDPQVYKKANIDRKLFSKIRCTPDYKPRKKTVIALAIALELDLSETVELLGRAEMAFSPGSRSDLIIEYCIENGIYSIIEINALLFAYDQPLLC